MTIAEWHLAAGSLDLGISGAMLYATSLGLLEVGVLSALGTTLGIGAGIAILVIATMEASGLPVPAKAVQTIVDLTGGPFSIVGGTIGMGINGQNGFEQGTRLGGLFDVFAADRDAFTTLMGDSSVTVKILSGEAAISANLSMYPPPSDSRQPIHLSNAPSSSSAEVTTKMQEITRQLIQLGSGPAEVRQSIPQSHTVNDNGDRWTHNNSPTLATILRPPTRQSPAPLPPATKPNPIAPPATPAPTPPATGAAPQTGSAVPSFPEQPDVAIPYQNSSGEDDAQDGPTLTVPP